MKFSSFYQKSGNLSQIDWWDEKQVRRHCFSPLTSKTTLMKVVTCLSIIISVQAVLAADTTGTINGRVSCARVKHLGNTVVFIEKVDGICMPSQWHAVVDQQNLVFVPQVLPIMVGTFVDFPNSDVVRHNVSSPPGSSNSFNLGTYDVGVTKTVTFPKVGEVPLLCNVHAEMSAFIVVLENPYFAITDETGEYTVENVPQGKYTLTTWHEKLRSESKGVTVEVGKTVEIDFELKRKR